MGEYKNITLQEIYHELKEVKKHLQHLEEIIIPEENLSKKELERIDKLRQEALKEYKEGKTVKIEDL